MNPHPNRTGIDKILDKELQLLLYLAVHGHGVSEDFTESKDAIKSALKKDIESLVPKKSKQTRGNSQNGMNPNLLTKHATGYNQCVDEITARVKEYFK